MAEADDEGRADVVPEDATTERPRPFDQDAASSMVGAITVIQFRKFNRENELVETVHHHGEIVWADPEGIIVRLSNGEDWWLPPLLDEFKPFPPEVAFVELNTGERVENPRYATYWNSWPAEDEEEDET